MALGPDDDIFADLDAARRRQQFAGAANAPNAARTAELAGANRQAWGHLKAGEIYALASAGLGPGDEVTKEAARRRAVKKVQNGFGWHSIGDVVKGTTRGATTVLAAPLEALQTSFRHYARNIREEGVLEGAVEATFSGADEPKTTLGIALLGDRGEGRGDLGSGYLPGGRARMVQAERAREYGTIGGHAITPGRLIGSVVVEPGTKPFTALSGLVDFAIAVGADPSNVALKAAGKARQAERLFVQPEPGLIQGLRRTVETDRVAEWLDSPAGRKVIDGIAAERDFDALWRRLGKKVDVGDVLELSRRNTPDEVRDYLEALLGITIRTKPTLGPVASQSPLIRRVRDARLWQGVPGQFIDFSDANKAVETIDAFLRNAGIRDPQRIARHTRAMAEATAPGATGADRFRVVTEAGAAVKDALIAHGVEGIRARSITKLFTDSVEELRRYNVDDIGQNVWFPGVKVGADNLPAASPHLVVEALNSKVPLPDPREIRRLTSRFRGALDFADTPLLALEHLQQKIWKPLVLLRGAWPVRVVGEEQIRMAAAGLDSFASHPLSALATVVADDGRLGKLLGAAGVDAGRASTDVLGEVFANAARLAPNPTAYSDALYRGRVADPVGRARGIVTRHKIAVDKAAPEYAQGWADELMQLRADPIGSRIAAGGLKAGDRTPNPLPGIDGIKDWFWEGTGRALRDDLAEAGVDVSTRPQADAYIDSVAQRLHVKTAGNPELLDAVATGEFRGVAMRAGERINPKFVTRLGEIIDVGPTRVKADLTVAARGGRSEISERMDSAVNWAFGQLMARPSNYLSRSSTFRQSYWQRIDELVPFMTPEARAGVLKAAEEAKLDAKAMASLRRRIGERTRIAGRLDLENADLVAKGHALEATRDLLYDLANKGQFADVTRLTIPFAEAYKEVMTRWAKLVVENPATVRRAQQVVEGARGAGWFRPDPTTGEEIFSYPGTAFVSEHLLGVRAPLVGRVAGLSLATNILPGFGPVVQYPASKIIPNRPEADWIREIFLPFGEPDTEGGFAESFLPAWAKKFHTALVNNDPDNDRLFGNAVMDVAAYLVSTGDYSTNSADEVDRLMAAATTKAKGLFALRGFAQFFAPSAPSPEFLVRDKDGDLMVARTLVQTFYELQEEDYETAPQRFLDAYGDGALLLMQGKTRGGARPTDVLDTWVRRNPALAKTHRSVYGYFAPQGGEFSIEAYSRQLRTGEREALSPAEAVAAANARVASLAYRQARAQVEGRTDPAARQWLAGIREDLTRQFPGYDPMPKDLGKVARTIRELERAAGNPTLASTDAGQGIAAYLSARKMALDAAKDLGLTAGFGKANSARHLRDYLRGVAAEIVAEHPDFAEVWDTLLAREMVDDEPEVKEAA